MWPASWWPVSFEFGVMWRERAERWHVGAGQLPTGRLGVIPASRDPGKWVGQPTNITQKSEIHSWINLFKSQYNRSKMPQLSSSTSPPLVLTSHHRPKWHLSPNVEYPSRNSRIASELPLHPGLGTPTRRAILYWRQPGTACLSSDPLRPCLPLRGFVYYWWRLSCWVKERHH
jgi:hypothetical protein